jgi:hypothetical protein
MPRLLLPYNAKGKYLFFNAVIEDAGINTSSAQKRTWDKAGFDFKSTSEAELF